jgi:hypothetical protein
MGQRLSLHLGTRSTGDGIIASSMLLRQWTGGIGIECKKNGPVLVNQVLSGSVMLTNPGPDCPLSLERSWHKIKSVSFSNPPVRHQVKGSEEVRHDQC